MTTSANTDRELWREREGDYCSPSIHVTVHGGIGINVGGTVHVRTLAEWHGLIEELKLWKPMTPKEVQKALDEAVPIPVSDEEIERIVAKVTDPAYCPPQPERVQLAAKVVQLTAERDQLLNGEKLGYDVLLQSRVEQLKTIDERLEVLEAAIPSLGSVARQQCRNLRNELLAMIEVAKAESEAF